MRFALFLHFVWSFDRFLLTCFFFFFSSFFQARVAARPYLRHSRLEREAAVCSWSLHCGTLERKLKSVETTLILLPFCLSLSQAMPQGRDLRVLWHPVRRGAEGQSFNPSRTRGQSAGMLVNYGVQNFMTFLTVFSLSFSCSITCCKFTHQVEKQVRFFLWTAGVSLVPACDPLDEKMKFQDMSHCCPLHQREPWRSLKLGQRRLGCWGPHLWLKCPERFVLVSTPPHLRLIRDCTFNSILCPCRGGPCFCP